MHSRADRLGDEEKLAQETEKPGNVVLEKPGKENVSRRREGLSQMLLMGQER